MSMDSLYEYGSRAGFWRIHREFSQRGPPLTVFGVALAGGIRRLWRRSRLRITMWSATAGAGSTISTWILPSASICKKRCGSTDRPVRQTAPGWYTATALTPASWWWSTAALIYDSDYTYDDDLPFWSEVACSDGSQRPHLIVPYTLDANDMRFATPVDSTPRSSFIPSERQL